MTLDQHLKATGKFFSTLILTLIPWQIPAAELNCPKREGGELLSSRIYIYVGCLEAKSSNH